MTTAKDIIPLLRKRHSTKNWDAPRWVFFEELRVGTGHNVNEWRFVMEDGKWRKQFKDGFNPEQRIDAWAMSAWKSDKYKSIAYEIKVSRTDFLREIAEPEKRATAMRFSNQFYFVAPDGIIKPSEVPEGCGLLLIRDGKVSISVGAPSREIAEPTWAFYAALVRSLGRKQEDALFDELVAIEEPVV